VGGSEWAQELSLLQNRDVTLERPLTGGEFDQAEQRLGVRFPPDLRSFLGAALPVSPKFPDWRHPTSSDIEAQLAWPFEGIRFDIEQNGFWWAAWGPRPPALAEAIRVAEASVAAAPRLIPIYGHRYLPAEPELAGNPVFSVYQTDIIFYGANLPSYLACEFGGTEWAAATSGEKRHIRFWTDLVEWSNR
jgi:hypothetical protein